MATEVNLVDAARHAWPNIQPFFVAGIGGNLATRLVTFANAVFAACPQQQVGAHPVINWAIQVRAVSNNITTEVLIADNAATLRIAVNPVYRLCWLASQLAVADLSLAQKAAILAGYNAAF